MSPPSTPADPTGPREPADPGPGRTLSDAERAVLDGIAGHENAADPGFVVQMGAGPARAGTADPRWARHRDLVIQAVVVVGIAALLLPASWVLAGLLLVAMTVIPVVVTVHTLRQARAGTRPGNRVVGEE